MGQTYDVAELAKLLQFTEPYCKMVLKSLGWKPSSPVDEQTAAQLAKKLKRPWPPTTH